MRKTDLDAKILREVLKNLCTRGFRVRESLFLRHGSNPETSSIVDDYYCEHSSDVNILEGPKVGGRDQEVIIPSTAQELIQFAGFLFTV